MLKNKKIYLFIFTFIFSLLIMMGVSEVYAANTNLTVPASYSINVGKTKKISAKINGKKVSYSKNKSKFTFKSSKKSVATVSSKGLITAKKAGTTYITVKLKSNKKVSKKITVTVKGGSSGLDLDGSDVNYIVGSTGKIRTVYNGKKLGYGTPKYKTSNKKVATVSNGTITAKKKGTAKITVKYKGKSKKITVNVYSKGTNNFYISKNSLPINGAALNYSTYNSKSRDTYVFRSYMEYFEKVGGGTLNITSGIFNLSGAIYVPSNVTINFSNGVVINKTSNTGTSKLSSAGSMFMCVKPSNSQKNSMYGGYDGEKNISFIGNGNVTINMEDTPSEKSGMAIVMGHNKNINISGITFTNMKHGHFLEMDASDGVNITNCVFKNQVQTDEGSRDECINLDTPDPVTNGFNHGWSKKDCTPNQNVTIKSCEFNNIQVGIGTHRYSKNKYHTNITIDNCNIENSRFYAIDARNWQNLNITNNNINGVGESTSGVHYSNTYYQKTRAIFMGGCSEFNIKGNTIKNVYFPIFACPVYNTNYPISYNTGLDSATCNNIATQNTFSDYEEGTIFRVYTNIITSGSSGFSVEPGSYANYPTI